MPVDEFHRAVAATALRATARYGFALGGGNALIAYGLIDRPTQDVDLFTDREHGVPPAAGAVETALRGAAYTVEREDSRSDLADIFDGMGDGLAEWLITGPDGAQMTLQMAYFERDRRPVTMDLGPVLNLEDVVGWKVVALPSRVEPRDYVDTAAALGQFTIEQLIGLARHLDPGLTDRDFAGARRQLDRVAGGLSARSGLSPADVATVRERFQAWPRGT